jgi:hypothetical protein
MGEAVDAGQRVVMPHPNLVIQCSPLRDVLGLKLDRCHATAEANRIPF